MKSLELFFKFFSSLRMVSMVDNILIISLSSRYEMKMDMHDFLLCFASRVINDLYIGYAKFFLVEAYYLFDSMHDMLQIIFWYVKDILRMMLGYDECMIFCDRIDIQKCQNIIIFIDFVRRYFSLSYATKETVWHLLDDD